MEVFKLKQTEILMKFSLEDRIAIVTGAGAGIGEGIALGFAGAGAHIVVAELDAGRGEAVGEKIRALGRKALPIAVDVTNGEQVQSIVEKSLAEFGKIDILVNNVGGSLGIMAPMLEISEEMWDSTLNLTLKSTFLCTRAVGRIMRDQRRGSVVNIASGAGERPYPPMVAYGAAKAGVINLTQASAVSLAPYNIRVNGIAPGNIVTPGTSYLKDFHQHAWDTIVPLGRPGYPEDIALAAIYLASDAADWVTGIVIDVRGGPYSGPIMLKEAEEAWKSSELRMKGGH